MYVLHVKSFTMWRIASAKKLLIIIIIERLFKTVLHRRVNSPIIDIVSVIDNFSTELKIDADWTNQVRYMHVQV